jgi:hypothetical protein
MGWPGVKPGAPHDDDAVHLLIAVLAVIPEGLALEPVGVAGAEGAGEPASGGQPLPVGGLRMGRGLRQGDRGAGTDLALGHCAHWPSYSLPTCLRIQPARALARRCNELAADMIRACPDRFGGFACLPLPDVDGALAELAYALDDLRLDGVVLFSNARGTYLGDPHFTPLFDELQRVPPSIKISRRPLKAAGVRARASAYSGELYQAFAPSIEGNSTIER